MEEYNLNTTDGWEYGTGRTQPPKNRGGIVAVLLILVIFLTGIVSVLGILNVRLFRQLKVQEEQEMAISFSALEEETMPTLPEVPMEAAMDRFSLDLGTGEQRLPNRPREGAMSLQEIYRANIPSVVSISCGFHGGSSSGTGVVLSQDGLIVTNAHVVEGAANITVQLSDDRVFSAQLLGLDEISDLALLQIDAQDLIPAVFGDSDTLQVGDSVVAIGDPLGVEFRGTMTDGIISAINRDVTVEGRVMNLIQTNAALNSGNSGGPLIDCYGQVVGINTMKVGDYMSHAGVEGLGFAIPSATVKSIVEQLLTQGYVSGRPTLGIEGESLSIFYQHYRRLPAGLYLTCVDENGPAGQAGILPGDILMTIDGETVTNMEELNTILYSHDVGDTVTVTIYRNGRQGASNLTIAEDKK